MNSFQTIRTPSLKPTSFRIEYGESFGVITREPTPKNITKEREFYVSKGGRVSFLIKGTLYPLEAGDAIMIAPHEYFRCIHYDDEPFRYYRILAEDSLVESAAPSLRVCSITRKARFCFPGAVRNKLYGVCENLLRDPNESSLYNILHFLDILCRHRATYTEEDAVIEKYEICLPLDLKKALLHIRNHTRGTFLLSATAEECGINPKAITKLFKEHLCMSAKEYAEGIRMAEATHLLLCEFSQAEVARMLGYSNAAQFSATFKRFYGTTPLRYIHSGGIVYHTDL